MMLRRASEKRLQSQDDGHESKRCVQKQGKDISNNADSNKGNHISDKVNDTGSGDSHDDRNDDVGR